LIKTNFIRQIIRRLNHVPLHYMKNCYMVVGILCESGCTSSLASYNKLWRLMQLEKNNSCLLIIEG
jgi:hypothetical protein